MRLSRIGLLLLCVVSVCVITACRIVLGPADLYEKDQPKTLAYTADILVNGRWALPRDVIYQPATKPPLYNWIAAAVMRTTGSWSELAMKSPSVIGAFGVGLLLVMAGRRWHERLAHEAGELNHERGACAATWGVGILAAAIWFTFGTDVRHASVERLMFLARPDMLQAFFLTGAWLAATQALAFLPSPSGRGVGGEGTLPSQNVLGRAASVPASASALTPNPSPRGRGGPILLLLAFWLCVIGSILTKGPLALLLIVYVPVAAWLITGSWRGVRVLWPVVGIVVTALAVGAWIWFAMRTDRDHVIDIMLGAEIVGRVAEQTPEGISKPFWYAAMWFLTKGGPFAILATMAGAFTLVSRRWFRRPDPITLGATLWLLILIVGLSLPAGKRMDYLLPAYAPAAWLAARLLISACERARVPVALAGVLPLLASLWLGYANLHSFHEARSHWSDRAVAFCSAVRKQVPDEDSLLVLVRGKHPLPALLHRHQGSYLTADDLANAHWLILPTNATRATPVLTSEPLPLGFETIDERPVSPLGLYHAANVPLDERIHAQLEVGQWTSDENPYRSPGTVWRETLAPQ